MEPLDIIMQATIDGQRWIVRTNGHAAIATPDETTPITRDTDVSGFLRTVVNAPLALINRDAVTIFCAVRCGQCCDTGKRHCSDCDGRGTEPAWCSDRGCDHAHAMSCRSCRGAKCVECEHQPDASAPAVFDASLSTFDRRLVAACLDGMPPGDLQIGTLVSPATKHPSQKRLTRALVMRSGNALGIVMEIAVTKRKMKTLPKLENVAIEEVPA